MDGRLVFALLSVCFATFLYRWRRTSCRWPRPPGPPGLPLIGNILPKQYPWEAIRRWGHTYGPLIRMSVLGTPALVVNSYEAAAELFEKRSSIYSQRHPMEMILLCGMDGGVLFETNPVKLRQARRLVATGVSSRELDIYRPQLRTHIAKMLEKFLHTPDKFLDHIQHLPGEIMLDIAYGYTSTGFNDPFIKEAETWIRNFAIAGSVTEYLVNWLPILSYVPQWLPGGAFKRTAALWNKQAVDFGESAFQFVVKAMTDGVSRPSVVSKAINSQDPYDRHVIVKSATQMVTGGADTSVSVIETFMLAMLLNPEVQRRAQDEIDRVVGADRLPTYSDRESLPFVEAVMREVMRWRPPVPMVPRHPTQDDVYNGYFIPKDTIVYINFWAMLHDEEKFPDHDKFDPDRWIGGGVTKDIDPFGIVFGFGRRECPGKLLAVELVFTTLANILAVFDITKARSTDGQLMTPAVAYSSGGISAPLPFKCNIKPRTERALKLLQETLACES
ncbi:cytochrome P450 [Cristinia sonorae]|uniref:Cytochrome P450 n=1 Tax=Cristinia sonorae TaxID=1940300 RepID=A0A8K0XSF1_9AGAR|nr:cytochrome P450 [Cristinia sonorae]